LVKISVAKTASRNGGVTSPYDVTISYCLAGEINCETFRKVSMKELADTPIRSAKLQLLHQLSS